MNDADHSSPSKRRGRWQAEARRIEAGKARRALVIACSMPRTDQPGDLPAYLRYPEPYFQELLRLGWTPSSLEPLIYLLSPQLGLVSATMPIPAGRAELDVPLGPTVRAALETSLSRHRWRDLLRSKTEIKIIADEPLLAVLQRWAASIDIDLHRRCSIIWSSVTEKRNDLPEAIRLGAVVPLRATTGAGLERRMAEPKVAIVQ